MSGKMAADMTAATAVGKQFDQSHSDGSVQPMGDLSAQSRTHLICNNRARGLRSKGGTAETTPGATATGLRSGRNRHGNRIPETGELSAQTRFRLIENSPGHNRRLEGRPTKETAISRRQGTNNR